MSDLLRLIGDEAYKEPAVRRLLLDPPAVMGVQGIDLDQFQVRLVARTLPGKQFEVGRILRARITAGFRREGMMTGVIHSDGSGEPVAQRTSTSATTASASLTCELLRTMTFSMGFMMGSSSAQ